MRIIDADDIVYESIDSTDTLREESYYGTGILAVRKEDIEAMPTIELPERKKGHWIVNVENENTISGSCSACGWQAHLYEDDVVGMNFCPNCGARMVKEGEEHD